MRADQPAGPAPTATLPSALPATPAAAPAADPERRWLISGLATLGAGLLAGLWGWRLYRRRRSSA